MAPEQAGALIGTIIGGLIGLALGSLVGAVILRAAAQWAEKLDIPFGSAYVTVLLSAFVNYVIGFIPGQSHVISH